MERETAIPATPDQVVARCAVFHTRQAARAVTAYFDAALQPSGLRATQLTLLVAVRQGDGATISALAAALGMDRTTLARDLRLLEQAGLVAIGVGRDRRARVVLLTPRGDQAMARSLPLWAVAQQRFEERIGTRRWRATVDELHATTEAAIAYRRAPGQ